MPRKNYPKRSLKTSYVAAVPVNLATPGQTACQQKRRFATEKQAAYQAETLELVHMTRLNTYHCMICRGWHLTSLNTST